MRTLRFPFTRRVPVAGLAVLVGVGAVVTGCASGASSAVQTGRAATTTSAMPGMPGMPGMGAAGTAAPAAGASGSAMAGMSGMDQPMYTGDGLSAAAAGLRLTPSNSAAVLLPTGQAARLSFRIEDPMGMAVTSFQPDQTQLMHLYVVRSDLTGFQHVHPTMTADGTWTAQLAAMQPGTYRAYASFVAKNDGTPDALVLSTPFTVAGTPSSAALPAAAGTAQVDGYTVSLAGDLTAGREDTLTASFAKGGAPVTDLQPYLDAYAHLTAFHQHDMAFGHLHPQGRVAGDHGGPTLTFHATMPTRGNYRLFLQFQTDGVVHTAAFTVSAR